MVETKKKTAIWYWRRFLLTFIPIILFSLSLLPTITLNWLFFRYVFYRSWWGLVLFPFELILTILLLIGCLLVITGGFIKVFHITYSEGTYANTLEEKPVFHWMLVCQLYTPMRKVLEAIPLGKVKNWYLRLLGMKIGKDCLIGGIIKDPCCTSFGDQVTMGEFAVLYSHVHDKAKSTFSVKKVHVDDRCVIGAGAIIMPGCYMQKKSVVGAGGIVPKNSVLKNDRVYVGNPVQEKPKRKTKPE